MREGAKNAQGTITRLQSRVKELELLVQEGRSEAKVRENQYHQEVQRLTDLVRQAEGHYKGKLETAEANQGNLRREL